jgi:5-methylcytosine-specific restriction endonuclease McrA
MAREFSDKFYHSKKWKDTRKLFIANRNSIDGGMCQRCKKDIGYIVHHKIELNETNINDPYISLGLDNLMWLCHTCHNEIHGIEPKRYEFDDDGNIIPIEVNE